MAYLYHGWAPTLAPLAHLFDRLSDWVHHAAHTVAVWNERITARRQLGELDNRMLQDIGLTRADIMREVDKPFWRD